MRQVKGFTPCPPPGGLPPAGAPNMRVALAHVVGKVEISLRFGQPLHEHRLDRWRSLAVFAPGAICCTVRWFGIDCGGPLWQLLVLRAPERLDAAVRVEGVAPRAQVLLRVHGEDRMQRVLALIACVEQSGVDLCALPAAYWRRLAKHLQANRAPPSSVALRAVRSAPSGRSR
jgi:hypothetical protein